MSAWDNQISIQLNKEYRKKLEKHKEEFKDKSPTQELYNRMDRIIENAPTPEEKAKELRKEAEKKMEEAEKWERKAKKREARQKLRDKKEELKKVNKKLEKAKENGIKSREEIEEEVLERWRGRNRFDDNASVEKIKEEVHFDRQVEKKLEKQPDLEELKKEKEKLEDEIREYEEVLDK